MFSMTQLQSETLSLLWRRYSSSSSVVQPSLSGYQATVSPASTTSGYTSTGSVQPIGTSSVQPNSYTSSGIVQSVSTAQPRTAETITVQPSSVQPVASSSGTTATNSASSRTSGNSATGSTSNTSITTIATNTTTTTTHALVARHPHQ